MIATYGFALSGLGEISGWIPWALPRAITCRPVGAEMLYFVVDPGFHPGLTSGHPFGVEDGRADRRGQGGKFTFVGVDLAKSPGSYRSR